MMRVFIHSRVLIAASYSSTEASREIIRQVIRGKIELVISNLVLEETRANLSIKAPQALPAYQQLAHVKI
jgi:predicted nucleic acid-binding protein